MFCTGVPVFLFKSKCGVLKMKNKLKLFAILGFFVFVAGCASNPSAVTSHPHEHVHPHDSEGGSSEKVSVITIADKIYVVYDIEGFEFNPDEKRDLDVLAKEALEMLKQLQEINIAMRSGRNFAFSSFVDYRFTDENIFCGIFKVFGARNNAKGDGLSLTNIGPEHTEYTFEKCDGVKGGDRGLINI